MYYGMGVVHYCTMVGPIPPRNLLSPWAFCKVVMIHDNVCQDLLQSVIGVSIDDLHYWNFSFSPWVVVFLFFQFCDVAELVIIDKLI